MGNLSVRRRKTKVPQIGDMRKRIVINERAIQPPGDGEFGFGQELTPIATVWASVETINGEKLFNDVNIEEKPTHLFIIRYRSDVEYKNVITYDGDNYKIVEPDDPNGKKRFLFLYCVILGDSTDEVNK